jgi:hypothetical protein
MYKSEHTNVCVGSPLPISIECLKTPKSLYKKRGTKVEVWRIRNLKNKNKISQFINNLLS